MQITILIIRVFELLFSPIHRKLKLSTNSFNLLASLIAIFHAIFDILAKIGGRRLALVACEKAFEYTYIIVYNIRIWVHSALPTHHDIIIKAICEPLKRLFRLDKQ